MALVGMYRNWGPKLQNPGKSRYKKVEFAQVLSQVAKEDPSQDQPKKVVQTAVSLPQGRSLLRRAQELSTPVRLLGCFAVWKNA